MFFIKRTKNANMIKHVFFLNLIFIFVFCLKVFPKTTSYSRVIDWETPKNIGVSDSQTVKTLFFKNALFTSASANLPSYFEKFQLTFIHQGTKIVLKKIIYVPCSEEETNILINFKYTNDTLSLQYSQMLEQKLPYIFVSMIPIRKNKINNQFEKLVSFEIEITEPDNPPSGKKGPVRSYVDHSVLADGKWYRLSVKNTGIYKLTYSDLLTMGINVNGIDPHNIRIYGNGAGMLPEMNTGAKNDDLVENAIYVFGEEDSKFNEGDYILFYGEDPVKWAYSSSDRQFHHTMNLYTEETNYFLTTDKGAGRRIQLKPSVTDPATDTVIKFTDYTYHELEDTNLIKSGREWYGETFDIKTTYNFSYLFPGIDLTSEVYFKASVAARSDVRSSFSFKANGNNLNVTAENISFLDYNGDYARPANGAMYFNTAMSTINLTCTYNKPNNSSTAWLNYFEFNVIKYLNITGNQLAFRNPLTVGNKKISEFILSNANSTVKIWDVTDHFNIKQIETTLNGTQLTFRLPTDTLREFIALNGTSFSSPAFIGEIENQDLHGLGAYNFIIISHPDFISEAKRLAQIHKENDSLTSVIVTPQQIYNEFSSGTQDIAAIRDFLKMLYDRASTPQLAPKYLLFFGDGSYNYKSRSNNTNFVPTYESVSSLQPIGSYVSDDFFGLLDDGEGSNSNGTLDIGIGRFPVQTITQAKAMVDKVARYITHPESGTNTSGCNSASASDSGDWKNVICFVADDEDNNLHFGQAEQLATYVDTSRKEFNVDKIYFDAFQQISTSAGQRYPDVTTAINKRIEKGALIMNYTGHGGELGWALERVLKVSDINSWTNYYKMPLFITATCEFSRFDDPARTSAGEYVLLNPIGGGIGLFTTTRLSFSSSNLSLNKSFYDYTLSKKNIQFYKMGDLIRLSKVANISSGENIKNYVLLGDPALTIPFPKYKVITTTINQDSVNKPTDTLKGFSLITVSGYVEDFNGKIKNDYNGTLYPTVYDKYSVVSTIANDPASQAKPFKIQNNIIFKGKASIKNGLFSFSFIVPKDISFQYGLGKISYYASSDKFNDAAGYFNKIIIGGLKNNFEQDTIGSQIRLFMNDSLFRSGGITNQSPFLLAYIKDVNGINTTGNGIGHDIVGVLDGNTEESIVLNDYYQTDINSFSGGTIKYPFSNLSEGKHTFTLKVWDIYNNSSVATIEFEVVQSDKLMLTEIQNYPNPFTGETRFRFEHNCPCYLMNVEINIYNMIGQKVKTINENIIPEGYDSNSIHWDGTSDGGSKLPAGLYIYHCKISTNDGRTAKKSSKLIIQNF